MFYSFGYLFLCLLIFFQELNSTDPLECKTTEKGTEYKGYKNTTISGRSCQAWAVLTPHRHKFSTGSVASQSNYCRNPDNDRVPWCYTTDPGHRYEFCDVPFCRCEIPAKLDPHLEYEEKEYRTNTYIRVLCEKGYDLRGYMFIYCQRNQTWKTDFPTCKGVECSISPHIDNVLIYERRQYFYPDNVLFTCPYGYNLIGSSVLSCGAGRFWNKAYPTCRGVKCEITEVRDRLQYINKEYRFPDKINFYCPIGYTLSGASVLACTETGIWNNAFPSCEVVHCPSPTPDSHLLFTSKRYVYLDTISLTCERGYNLEGSDSSHCRYNGEWSPALPTCKGVVCPDLRSFTSAPRLVFDYREYRYPEKVDFSCDLGYRILGSAEVSCLHTGKWSATIPTCEKVRCPRINITAFLQLEHGQIQEHYFYKHHVNLSCSEGTMQGSAVLVCEANGQWSDRQPVCIRAAEQHDKMSGGSVAGLVIFVIIFVAVSVVLGFIFIRRRKRKKAAGQRKVTYSIRLDASIKRRNTELFSSFLPGDENNEKNSTYQNVDFPSQQTHDYYEFTPKGSFPDGVVPVKQFGVFVQTKLQDGNYFKSEFEKLKSGLLDDCTNAHLPINKTKNKYKKIYPYDRNRVILEKEEPNNTDYINASYINGYGTVNSYIAAQGPIETTLVDFWRMVWQRVIGKIVMLTNVEEDGKVKCHQYWPVSRETIFGNIYVKMTSEENYGDYTIRKLAVRKGTDVRRVKQFHFTAWPDKSIPLHPDCLIEFRKKVVNADDVSKEPILVHCSAGVGRTGTFIALDCLITEANSAGTINVFSCVETLRRQRLNMVQTLEQYQFLYEALVEHIQGSTAIRYREFPEAYRELTKEDPQTGKTELQKQYKALCTQTLVLPENAIVAGKTDLNKRKSRYNNVLPVDKYRPLLHSADGDFINAVFLPCNKKKMAYIMTQMPLPNTIEDFLHLIYEQHVNAIVMLNTEENDEVYSIGNYCPESRDGMYFGPFHVKTDHKALLDSVEVVSLCLRYKQQVPRGIKVFKFLSWPENRPKPYSVTEFLQLHDLVHDWHKPTEDDPLVVHCMNGSDKSGLFCVVDTILDAIHHNDVIDIQRTIKDMRLRRPQVISSLEQYEFCYEVIAQYLKQFEVYANM